MSVFKGHEDLSLNRYYYSFYSFSQSDPYTIKSFVYDQNQTLISSQDISFNSRNVPAMLTFLENSQVNPYALGKSNDEYLNMDIAFAGLYKKALSQKQQQTLMTSINNTYKNVYYGTVKTFTVQVQPSSADSSIPVFILNQNTNDENPDVMVGTVGLYIFDQSHPSNANYPLAFRNIGTQTPYTTNVIVEGTPGTPNSYTLITIDNVSSRMYVEYYTPSTESNADSISGELFNYVYQVHVVNNVFGDPVFSIQSPGESAFVEQPDLSFNSGDFALFYVGDSSMEPYNLVFGTTIDDNTSVIPSQFYNETEDGIITLDLTSGYTEGPVYYFEDTSAGMGYVSPYSNIVATTVLIREDFNNTSVLDGWGKNVSYVYNYNLAGVGDPLTFVNGDYAISQSDYEVGQTWHQYLHRLVNNSGDAHDGYDWHTSKGSYINDPTNINNGKAKSNIYTNGVQGSWIQMKMPYKMNVKSVSITGRNSNGLAHPRDAHLFGSNDNGSTFHHIGDISFNQQQANQTVDISSNTDSYDLLRMVVSRTYNQDHCHIDYWALIGDVYQFVEPEVNTYTVEVSNNAFWIQRPGDSGLLPKPVIDLTDITTVYLFDQSDSSNIGNQLVIGTSPDISSSIVSSSTTTMGTPGQPGAYTKYVSDGSIVYYFSYQNENMGEEPLTYTVKVVNHEVTDKPVFSIKAPTPVDASFIVQPNISFDAGDKYQFDIRDQTMTDFSLVFGTTVDNIGTVNESIVSRYDGTIILGISNIYGSQFVYFEESSAGMGYVPSSSGATLYTVEVSNNAFWIQRPQYTGLVEKAPISFSSGTTYLFDQSHSSNAGNTLIIGTNIDVSTSIISEDKGLTIMGTPGQPGAYTEYNANRSDVVYFSYQNENMGEYIPTYTVRVENHEVTGNPVFSIKAPTPVDASFIVQPDLSFGAGDKYQFDITDQTMTDFSLVFGTIVDNIGTVNESIVSRHDGVIILGISPSYNLDRLVYFEDSSAGMGYVPSNSGGNYNVIQTNFNITSGFSSGITGIAGTNLNSTTETTKNFTVSSSTYSFAIGDYKLQVSSKDGYGNIMDTLRGGNGAYDWSSYPERYNNGTVDSLYNGSETLTVDGVDYKGDWIEIHLPYDMIISSLVMQGRGGLPYRYPKVFYMFGSSNGSNYEFIQEITTSLSGFTTDVYNNNFTLTIPISSTNNYNIFRMMVNELHPLPSNVAVDNDREINIGRWEVQGNVIGLLPIVSYTVTVAGSKFELNGTTPSISFSENTIYIFDQSDISNKDNTLVIGSSIDQLNTIVTSDLTIVGTPGQPGAYTKYVSDGSTVHYFSYQTSSMGQ